MKPASSVAVGESAQASALPPAVVGRSSSGSRDRATTWSRSGWRSRANGDILDVVGVVLDRGADDEGLRDAVRVHLVDELLDRPAARPRRGRAGSTANAARRGSGCRGSIRPCRLRAGSSRPGHGGLQAPRGLYRFNFARAVVDCRSISSGSNRMSPWRWMRVEGLCDQELRGCPSQLVLGLADRRERRREHLGEVDVVVSDDADVAGNANAPLGEGPKNRERDLVVDAHHRGRPIRRARGTRRPPARPARTP